MKKENSTKPVFNGNLKITTYIPREQVIKLNKIKNAILENYNIVIPVSDFYRAAITEYLKTNFPDNEPLRDSIMDYIYSRDDIKTKIEGVVK